MKKINAVDLIYIVLTVFWCMIIFGFSSQNGGESGGLSQRVCNFLAENFVSDFDNMSLSEQSDVIDNMHLFVRKTAHFCEYAMLGFLVSSVFRRKTLLVRGALSEGFVIVYAIIDEIHQLFIPDRNGNPVDVMIDSLGGIAGIVFGVIVFKIISALKERRLENKR